MPCNNFVNDRISLPHPYFRGSKRKYWSLCPAYCDCDFPKNTAITSLRDGPIPDLCKCRCGENDPVTHKLHWSWQDCASNTTDTIVSGRDVTFHPTYSQGTAIVRGDQSLDAGMLHFWEIRTITALSGTDVMFGIGTDKVDLNKFKFHFVSALGTNTQSWGFSYESRIQHNGRHTPYGQKFSQGVVVGVLLDRIRGQLEFFLNRRPMGVAFTNIPIDPNVKLYPMVSSTTAKSCIRLMNATSQAECLQLRAFRVLAKQPKALEQLKEMPGLRTILMNYWFLAPPIRYSSESEASKYDLLDEAVLSSRNRKKYRFGEQDADDIYKTCGNAYDYLYHSSESDCEFILSDDESDYLS